MTQDLDPPRSGNVQPREVEENPFDPDTTLVGDFATERTHFGGMAGRSPVMHTLFENLRRAARTDATVLIEGETGTGKEASSEAIHNQSRRCRGPFVVIDCASIPPQLLESELFGNERGAFTGAVSARAGAFEVASGGTIFLDEVGELGAELQPRILRVLERKQIKRVGSSLYQPVDVRVVAATNRSLRSEVAAGKFRSDLYYRLAVVQIRLPPLRERLADLPLIIDSLLELLDARDSPQAQALRSPEFLSVLEQYHWPGNIRQLRNYLERYLAMGGSSFPSPVDSLPPPRFSAPAPPSLGSPRSLGAPNSLSAPNSTLGAASLNWGVPAPPLTPAITQPPLTPPSPAPISVPSSTLNPTLAVAAPIATEPPRTITSVNVLPIDVTQPLRQARNECVAAFERSYLEAILTAHGNNVSAAARAAGVDRAHFYRLLWKYGLKTP